MVYIKEAHPGPRQGVEQPKTKEERNKVATVCATKLALDLPFVVDEMDNKVEEHYAGWPDRLYIVGTDGKIAFKGGMGPGGFKVNLMTKKLDEILKTGQASKK